MYKLQTMQCPSSSKDTLLFWQLLVSKITCEKDPCEKEASRIITAATILQDMNWKVVKVSILFSTVVFLIVLFHFISTSLMSFCSEVTMICIPRAPENPNRSANSLYGGSQE